MRLTEMGVKPTAKKINKVMESRFGVTIDYNNLNFPKAYTLACGLTENLEKIKDFILEKYPGTENPSSYASEVTLIDPLNAVNREQRIFMNNIAQTPAIGELFFLVAQMQNYFGAAL